MYRAAAAAAAAVISRSSSSVVRRELARGGVYGGAEQRRWTRRFAGKEVNFGFDARAAILRGVNDPAPVDAVKGTYVIFERGFTVAKMMELDDSAEKVGASLMKQLAAVESVKDRGLLETDALDRLIFADGATDLNLRILEENISFLDMQSLCVQFGTTCGSVTMEGLKATRVIIPQLKWKAWMMDSADEINQEKEYPQILSDDKKILNMNSLVPALQILFKNCRPLVIFAEDADGEALSMLNKICTVKALGFGENRRGHWNDMAVSTGGQLVRRFEHRRLFSTNRRETDSHKDQDTENENNGRKGKQEDFTFFEMLKWAIKSLLSKAKSMLDGEGAFTELQRIFLVLSAISVVQYGCFRVLEVADAHHVKKIEDRFAAEETKLEAWRRERELVLVNQKRDAALFAAAEAEIRCEESSRHAQNLVKNLAMLGRDIFYLSGETMEVKWLLTAVGDVPKEE